MGDLEVPAHVVEAIVNNVSGTKGGVPGVYNKSVYSKRRLPRLADGMQSWNALPDYG